MGTHGRLQFTRVDQFERHVVEPRLARRRGRGCAGAWPATRAAQRRRQNEAVLPLGRT
jgi:hypothetical protein